MTVVPLGSRTLESAEPPLALADLATAQEVLGLGEGVTRFDLILRGDDPTLPLEAGERLQRPARKSTAAEEALNQYFGDDGVSLADASTAFRAL